MSMLRDLPISRKFTFAFGIVCALCIAMGVYTFFTFRSIETSAVDVSENSFPSVLLLTDMRSAANNVRREDLDLLLCSAPACTVEHTERLKEAFAAYHSSSVKYGALVSYPGERELFQKVSADMDRYEEMGAVAPTPS